MIKYAKEQSNEKGFQDDQFNLLFSIVCNDSSHQLISALYSCKDVSINLRYRLLIEYQKKYPSLRLKDQSNLEKYKQEITFLNDWNDKTKPIDNNYINQFLRHALSIQVEHNSSKLTEDFLGLQQFYKMIIGELCNEKQHLNLHKYNYVNCFNIYVNGPIPQIDWV